MLTDIGLCYFQHIIIYLSMKVYILSLILFLLAGCQKSRLTECKYADYVDTKIGVIDNRGNNCVIGPRMPYGSIYPSPQTPEGENDGYHPEKPIRGFGQLHVSGTGWGSYGHFLVSPQVGDLELDLEKHDSPHSQDSTKAYYYSTFLDRYKTKVEIAPTHYSAIYRFTFPNSSKSSILFDASHAIPTDIAKYIKGTMLESSAQIDPKENKLRMKIKYRGGWMPEAYDLYLVGQYDKKAVETGVWKGDIILPKNSSIENSTDSRHVGAYCTFETKEGENVHLKVAISFTGYEKAERLLAQEIPDWDFEQIRNRGRQVWEDKFRSIEIETDSEEENIIFYSSMFRLFTLASDRSLDYAEQSEVRPVWDDNYAFWDTFRSAYPLLMLIDEPAIRSNILAVIDRFHTNGVVHDGFVAGRDKIDEQGGNDIDHILAEACLKDIKGIDWNEVYKIVKYNADNRRIGYYNWQKSVGDNHKKYKELGWIPETIMSSSQTMEFAYNDYSAALMAQKLGYEDDYNRYMKRSHQWVNLWNPELESHGFKGFIDARKENGEFAFFEPTKNGGSWATPFYEVSPWTCSYYTPHDFDKLISLMGGKELFVERLNYGFEKDLVKYTNEPGFLLTRAFTHAGRPDLSSYWTHDIMRNRYDLAGYPENEDTGSMASWYIFCSVGLFPNAGQDYYYLNAPKHSKAILKLANGKTLTVIANASEKNIYVESCALNGKQWNKPTIKHSDIVNGGVIEMKLSEVPTKWGMQF